MLTPSTSLILKHVVGSAFGAHGATTGNAVRAADAQLFAHPCTARPCSECCLCSHAAIHAHPGSTPRPDQSSGHLAQACQDGAPGGAREQPFASKQALLLLTWGCCTAQGPYLGRVHARGKAEIRIPLSLYRLKSGSDRPPIGRNWACIPARKVCGGGFNSFPLVCMTS